MISPPPTVPLVRMTGIGKRFGNVSVLHDVSLEVFPREVLVLAGENGAGKSTLIKILGGVHTDFDGELEIDGRAARPRSPLEANSLGVAVIFQELSLIPSLSVADNIFLGRNLVRAGFVDDREQRAQSKRLLDRLGIDLDVDQRVEDLPVAQQQLVEIAKALAHESTVIVMDEPTSSLNAPEVEKLFGLIQQLKTDGCGIIYITHKMEEIARIADRITVLRDGRHIGTAPASDVSPDKLVSWMVGRDQDHQFPDRSARPGRTQLRLDRFSVLDETGRRPIVDSITLELHAGEILGLAGLQGSGTSELFLALFGGSNRRVQGQVFLNDGPLRIRNPRTAIRQGIALLTNDRKATGLVLPLSIIANCTLAALPRLSPGAWRRPGREEALTQSLGRSLNLRAASLHLEVGALSGGNQQKVALAKWLLTEPQVLMLDEPTRGIDVGAKREIYQLLDELTSRGIGILLITSELPELLALSDRILVLHRGRLTGEFTRSQATPERILEAAMGKIQSGL